MSNRLAAERSPYLLQHAENPVDWYPWGAEAFAKAREDGKPIFLSIGYSTCHWCHVMEHESFESRAVADVLNEKFVSIKVDREERPDLDRVYMSFVQATTGSGGWPMSVWLTPDLKPFFGGTYFPPDSRWGRPGFVEILNHISQVWTSDRGRVTGSAEQVMARLRAAHDGRAGRTDSAPGAEAGPGGVTGRSRLVAALREAVAQSAQAYDAERGGFGDAPKFPRPAELLFLLREHARTGETSPRDMAVGTLRAMALGGMRDHVGGGFHRYSVDAEWRVPHFEKMLYDQAQLVLAYLEAAQVTDDAVHATVAADTLTYVLREMTDPAGGFYSAEDADSVPPELVATPSPVKQEGAFYVWTDEEIGAVLGDTADLARHRFDIRPEGNAPHDPQGEFRHKNLLYIARSTDEVATRAARSADEVSTALAVVRRTLFETRSERPRPHLDDKILTSWNGLMIAAFARAARVLEAREEDGSGATAYLEAARRAAAFVHRRMWNEETGTLYRRYRAGEAGIDGYCEDYAGLVWGLVELIQADPDPMWLEWALRLQRRQDELFWDADEGGWFSTSGEDPTVLLRLKEEYDGAEPSANSLSAMNVLTLGHLTGEAGFAEKVDRMLVRYGSRLGGLARVLPYFMSVVSTLQAGVRQVVLVGPADDETTRAMRRVLARTYSPFTLVIHVEPGDRQARMAGLLPWVGRMTTRGDRATAYVCRDFACQEPVNDVAGLERVLVAG